MILASNVIAPARFVSVTPLAPATGPAPKITDTPGMDEPQGVEDMVSVRYRGTREAGGAQGRTSQVTVNYESAGTGEQWYTVKGAFSDAVAAARTLTTPDGGDPATENRGVAVLQSGAGVWQLTRMAFTDGMDDGMDAIISMPIDKISAETSAVSVPYGGSDWGGFDTPRSIAVRFNDPRVAAVVGTDSIAMPPAAT